MILGFDHGGAGLMLLGEGSREDDLTSGEGCGLDMVKVRCGVVWCGFVGRAPETEEVPTGLEACTVSREMFLSAGKVRGLGVGKQASQKRCSSTKSPIQIGCEMLVGKVKQTPRGSSVSHRTEREKRHDDMTYDREILLVGHFKVSSISS